MKVIKLLAVGLFSFTAGFGAYALMYKNRFKTVIDNLIFKVLNITDFKINASKLSANVYLQAINTTSESISLNSGGFLKAKEIRVYDKKSTKLLAVSDLNIQDIYLAPNGFYNFPKVFVEIPLIDGALIVISQLTSQSDSFLKRLSFELDFEVLTTKQTIKF